MIHKMFLGVLIGGAIGAALGYFGKCSSGACPLTANPYRGAVYGAIMGALIVLTSSRTRITEPPYTEQSRENVTSMVHQVADESFQRDVLNSTLPVVIDMWAPWCAPCRMVSPVIEKLAEDNAGKIKVYKMNVDKNMKTARRYGINGIPAVLFFKDGKELKRLRIIGARRKATYQKAIDKATGLVAGN